MSKKLDIKELKAMSKGLAVALKHGNGLRFRTLEGIYAECLVARKLLENEHSVEFSPSKFDLKVDGKIDVEVKCGKLWEDTASASFGKGDQITKAKFHRCVFVIIDEGTFKPRKFFVFTLDDLKECGERLRPKLAKYKGNSSQLFFFENFEKFKGELEKKGEKILDIEEKLYNNRHEFENRWDKIR